MTAPVSKAAAVRALVAELADAGHDERTIADMATISLSRVQQILDAIERNADEVAQWPLPPDVKPAREPKARAAKAPTTAVKRTPRAEAQHGSIGGWQRHRRAGEQPCDDCMEARRTYQRNLKRAQRGTKPTSGPQPTAPCGTVSAYQRHIRHGEIPCQPCADARNAKRRERRAAKKSAS